MNMYKIYSIHSPVFQNLHEHFGFEMALKYIFKHPTSYELMEAPDISDPVKKPGFWMTCEKAQIENLLEHAAPQSGMKKKALGVFFEFGGYSNEATSLKRAYLLVRNDKAMQDDVFSRLKELLDTEKIEQIIEKTRKKSNGALHI